MVKRAEFQCGGRPQYLHQISLHYCHRHHASDLRSDGVWHPFLIEWTSTPRRPAERRGFRAPFAYTCRMRIVTYRDLRPGRFAKPLERLRAALARGDFAAAGLKKLAPTPYWRAKLSDEARLLMQFAPYNGETVCLFLEVIADHAYEKSRFLRGAPVDRDKIEAGPDDRTPQPEPSARLGWELKWLPPEAVEFDLIDKPIVLDAAQEAVRRHAPPLVIIGPAGSGKTAVTLAKMREATGNVLYVTLSAYLAQTARRLYGAHGYENPRQDAEFMSFREFVDSIAVPEGEEVRFAAFRAWFERRRGGLKGDLRQADAHALLEEFRGVLGAPAGGALTETEYQALGVRQSLYPAGDARAAVHELFEKYRAWLKEERLYRSQPRLARLAREGRAALRFRRRRRSAGFHQRRARADPRYAESQGSFPAVRRFAPDRASELLFLGFGSRAVLANGAGGRGRFRRARNLRPADQFPQHSGRHRPRQSSPEDQAGAFRLGRPREQFPRPVRLRRGGRGAIAQGRGQGLARAQRHVARVRSLRRHRPARRGQGGRPRPVRNAAHLLRPRGERPRISERHPVPDDLGEPRSLRRSVPRRGAERSRRRGARLPPRQGQDRQVARDQQVLRQRALCRDDPRRRGTDDRRDRRSAPVAPTARTQGDRGYRADGGSGVEQGRMGARGPQARTAGQAGAGARDPGNVSGRAADAVDALVAANPAGMDAQGARSQESVRQDQTGRCSIMRCGTDRAPMSKGSPKRISRPR